MRVVATIILALTLCAGVAFGVDEAPLPTAVERHYAERYSDSLAPFDEKMFWFNLKVDDYLLHPVASGYASVMPEPARESVGRFFDNVGFIPRSANKFLLLRFAKAAGAVARFGINTTLGAAGLFDVAEKWFSLKQSDNDLGLTLGQYGVAPGWYVVWPFLGPSTIRDAIGMAADQFEEADRYAIDVYGAVQDGYLERRA